MRELASSNNEAWALAGFSHSTTAVAHTFGDTILSLSSRARRCRITPSAINKRVANLKKSQLHQTDTMKWSTAVQLTCQEQFISSRLVHRLFLSRLPPRRPPPPKSPSLHYIIESAIAPVHLSHTCCIPSCHAGLGQRSQTQRRSSGRRARSLRRPKQVLNRMGAAPQPSIFRYAEHRVEKTLTTLS